MRSENHDVLKVFITDVLINLQLDITINSDYKFYFSNHCTCNFKYQNMVILYISSLYIKQIKNKSKPYINLPNDPYLPSIYSRAITSLVLPRHISFYRRW